MIKLTSVSPVIAQQGVDTTIEIVGSGFLTTTAVSMVSPQIVPLTYPMPPITFLTSELIRVVVPANSLPIGYYSVVVENASDDVAGLSLAFRVSVDLPARPFLTGNTTDNVQARIMDRIGVAPTGLPYDRRRGQVPWDMAAAQGPEFERIYKRMDELFPQGFAQFMGGTLLDLRAEEHGVLRNPASYALGVVEVTAAVDTVIPTTMRVSTTATPNTTDRPIIFNSIETSSILQKNPVSGLVTAATATSITDSTASWGVDEWKGYTVLITAGAGVGQWRQVINNTATQLNVINWSATSLPNNTSTYRLFTGVAIQADLAGRQGNVLAGAINRLASPVAFVTAITNPVATFGGVDIESDRLFLARFLLTVRQPSAGGNDTDYEIWARETPGTSLGAVSVIPEWAGYGTVKVVVINSDNTIPGAETVNRIHAYIETKRPIGADVTVEAAVALGIEARFTLTAQEGFNLATVQEQARQAIIVYLSALPVGGDDGLVLFYRVQQAAIENTEGIDTFNMYSSGYGIRKTGAPSFSTSDIVVAGTEKPVAGTVTVA
jgi:uncharacterized phage protein gp47/JayE